MTKLLDDITFRTHTLSTTPVPLATAVERIVEASRQLDAARSARERTRLVVPVEPPAIFDWLDRIPAFPKFHWQSRDGERVLVGAGVAAVLESDDLSAIDDFIAADDSELSLGVVTVRFDRREAPSASWRDFGVCRVYVPEIALVADGDRWRLVAHVGDGLEALTRAEAPTSTGSLPYFEALPSDRPGWIDGIDTLLDTIRSGRLEKTVVARTERLIAARPFSPLAILRRLAEVHSDAFRFAVVLSPDRAFLGASPERLYHRIDREIESEAVAGTRVRGHSRDADDALASDLENDPKEAREHALVVEHIAERMKTICSTSEVDATAIQALVNVQHLRSRVRGALRAGVGDRSIIAAIHPTPAVCGSPQPVALDTIHAFESFDRGLYAGVVGLIGRRRSECAVALRSALVEGPTLTLFGGAGIVEGSDPSSEWEETTAKLRAVRDVLDAVER